MVKNKMNRISSNPTSVHHPVGMYTHFTKVKTSTFVFLAGQVSIDENNQIVGIGDIGTQTRKAYENIGKILTEAGSSFSDVVQVRTYIVGQNNVDSYLETRAEIFKTIYPSNNYPPNTLLVIAGLLDPEMLIEIEIVAAIS